MRKIIVMIGALLLVFSCTAYAGPVEVIPPQNKVLGTSSGRFIFGQISEMRRDQFMLDTQTGRLWQRVESKDGSFTTLEAVPYDHLDGGAYVVPEEIRDAAWKDLKELYEPFLKKQAGKDVTDDIWNQDWVPIEREQ